METKEKCEEVLKARGWTQRELAKHLGIPEQNMTHVMKGRRGLPTPAMIKLERLRGLDDHSIIEQLLKTAACFAVATVILLMTVAGNSADASNTYDVSTKQSKHYEHSSTARIRRLVARLARVIARALSVLRRIPNGLEIDGSKGSQVPA